MESLRWSQVVQVVEALECVVLRAFGPHGGSVLFTRATGQAEISRSGARLLRALQLDNPLARMIVESASAHSSRTGDGSKSFILLLASLARNIERAACSDQRSSSASSTVRSAARRLAHQLLSLSLHRLDHLLSTAILPHSQQLVWEKVRAASQKSPVHNLLSTFFRTRFNQNNATFLSDLLCELLSTCACKSPHPQSCLPFIIDKFPALCTPVTGFPVSCSRTLPGQIIHRDFASSSILPPKGPIKAIIVTTDLQPKLESLELRHERSILDFISYAESSVERFISCAQSLGVSVLLSTVKQSTAPLGVAAQAGVSVVECVDQEDTALFMRLSGAEAVWECGNVQPEQVVTLEFCKPILLGAHRYVHVGFSDQADFGPCSLVVCGAGEGQTEQLTVAMEDALKMLLTTWGPPGHHICPHGSALTTCDPPASAQTPPGHHICPHGSALTACDPPASAQTPPGHHNCPHGSALPAGGTFEFLLSRALRQESLRSDSVSQILADSLLCVPRRIYSHKPRLFAQIQSEAFQRIQEQRVGSERRSQDPGLESVRCKRQLLVDVCQCVSQLFHVDAIIHTRSRIKSVKEICCEDEDEAEVEGTLTL
ncbi:hypothetical protein WMY93_023457 [Mugilogobius chulae]|uniref:Bardet-Biedl syndrome 10 n=1 Tax=Mugilogobius chulae TaxID=88201 RepID=A0AAW0N4A9_9GOBI